MWMSAEAPADYVGFVGRCLPQLRASVAREVPAPARAEVLSEALSGLARRWVPLRAAALLLRRPDLTGRYLDRVVRREARRWRERQIYPVDLVVRQEFRPVEADGETPGVLDISGDSGRNNAVTGVRPASIGRVSVALRRAAVLDSTVRPGSAALAEASIAWWHAYAARRHTSRVIRLTVVALIVLVYLTAQV